jgi:hypothetical protein
LVITKFNLGLRAYKGNTMDEYKEYKLKEAKHYEDFKQWVSEIQVDCPDMYVSNYVCLVANDLCNDFDSLFDLVQVSDEEIWEYFKRYEVTQ